MTRHRRGEDAAPGRPGSSESAIEPGSVLEVLDDADCRALLEAVTEEARTAQELIDRCDVPRSTVYRKLDRLVAAGLLAEQVRIDPDGAHATEYRNAVEDVVITVTDAGELDVRTPDAAASRP